MGLASVLSVPAGVALSWYSEAVTLLDSMGAAGLALLFGWAAVVLSRRGRETVERTLGRAGGLLEAKAGLILGLAGVWIALTAALAVAFYGLLTLFAG